MTAKRLILILLTVLATFVVGGSLWQSWSEPQFQSRLELYQTDLILQASEFQSADPNLIAARRALLGTEPTKNAAEQYQESRQLAEKALQTLQAKLEQEKLAQAAANAGNSTPEARSLSGNTYKLEQLIAELDLRLGILQASQNSLTEAQKTWATMIQQTSSQPMLESLSKTAGDLAELWSLPPRIPPDPELGLKQNLNGWFRYRALSKLYQVQQRQELLQSLQAEEQVAAEQAFNSLAIVGGLPALGCFAGVSVLLFVIGQWLVRRKQALLSLSGMAAWSTPWDAEAILQVFVGFLIASPLIALTLRGLIQILGIDLMEQGWRATALFYLINYVLVAAGSLTILYLCIKPFLPLPESWFRFTLRGNWLWWGLGSYFAALPLVIAISFLNQKIWQGQGGSNEILRIVFQGKDNVALAIFFVTATIAAPIFEEILFRGFLLPSLTRYLPVWGAIALSGLVFALAHLSLSEVLPLTVLGMVLGFVYTRSRNLLASMLLHCLWNSGTLLSLFILGGSAH